MSKKIKQSFIGGVLTLLIANIVIKIFGALYRIVLTNIDGFGDVGNSIYGAGYKVYVVLLALSTTGIPVALAKLVSEKEALKDYKATHKLFKTALALFSTIGIICSLIFFLGARQISTYIKNPDAVLVMQVLAPAIFFVSVSAVFRGYFQGLSDMKPQANSQMIDQFIKCFASIAIVILLLSLSMDTKTLAAGATLGSTLGTIISLLYLLWYYEKNKKIIYNDIENQEVKTDNTSTGKLIKILIKLAFPISLGAIITTIAGFVDLVTVMNGLQNSGFTYLESQNLYGILTGKADVLVNLPLALNAVFAVALVPAVSGAMAIGDKDSASRKISFSLKTTLLIGLPSSIGLFVLANPIVNALFPNAPNGSDIVGIAGLSILFIALTQTLAGSLQGLGKVKTPVIALLTGAVAKYILNLILVPNVNINAKGAAFSSIICYLISTLISITILIKNIKLKGSWFHLVGKPVISSIIMGIGTYYIYNILLNYTTSAIKITTICIIFACIIYGLMLIGLRVFNEEEYAMIPGGTKIGKCLKKLKLL